MYVAFRMTAGNADLNQVPGQMRWTVFRALPAFLQYLEVGYLPIIIEGEDTCLMKLKQDGETKHLSGYLGFYIDLIGS